MSSSIDNLWIWLLRDLIQGVSFLSVPILLSLKVEFSGSLCQHMTIYELLKQYACKPPSSTRVILHYGDILRSTVSISSSIKHFYRYFLEFPSAGVNFVFFLSSVAIY